MTRQKSIEKESFFPKAIYRCFYSDSKNLTTGFAKSVRIQSKMIFTFSSQCAMIRGQKSGYCLDFLEKGKCKILQFQAALFDIFYWFLPADGFSIGSLDENNRLNRLAFSLFLPKTTFYLSF